MGENGRVPGRIAKDGLTELNREIDSLRTRLNARAFRKLPGTRQALFITLDRPAMKALPESSYVFAEWRRARVHIDYHIEIDGHYYSVPYQLVGQQLEVRLTAHTVEVLHGGSRVASHVRSPVKGRHTTIVVHMPKAHREYAQWTPQRLMAWATHSGPATAQLIGQVMDSRAHPQQGFRSCLGIMRLGKIYSPERLEAACLRALALNTLSYRSLESMLRQGLEREPLPARNKPSDPIAHPNVRGPGYYQ